MALGFAQDNNLQESDNALSAAGILNNLGGSGIADDISLFAGNLSYVHELDYGADGFSATNKAFVEPDEVIYTAGGSLNASDLTYIVIPITVFGRIPYSNGTVLYTLNNANQREYHITANSNGIDRFQLLEYNNSTGATGSARTWDYFLALNTKKFFRAEPVYFENILNYSRTRPVINDETGGYRNRYNSTNANDESENENSPEADRDASNQVTFLKVQSLNTYDTTLEIARGELKYRESKNLVNYKPSIFDQTLELLGPTHIVNDSNIPLSNLEVPGSVQPPGLYIFGEGQVQRAFSDKNNPWVEASNYAMVDGTSRNAIKTQDIQLVESGPFTHSQSARVLNLIWEDKPVILLKGTGANTSVRSAVSSFDVASNWTHKAKVTVNGEDYFLLLTNDETKFI